MGEVVLGRYGTTLTFALPSFADAAKTVVKTKGTYAPTGADYTEAYARYERTDATLNV